MLSARMRRSFCVRSAPFNHASGCVRYAFSVHSDHAQRVFSVRSAYVKVRSVRVQGALIAFTARSLGVQRAYGVHEASVRRAFCVHSACV